MILAYSLLLKLDNNPIPILKPDYEIQE